MKNTNNNNQKNLNIKKLSNNKKEAQNAEPGKESFYKSIKAIQFETACYSASAEYIKELKEQSVRADKRKVNSLMKKLCPDFYDCLSLDLYNPYHYFRTHNKIIIIHSAIEYVFKLEQAA